MKVYPSIYCDEKLTAAQYLAERMCERVAKKEGKELFPKFWSSPIWKKTFMQQLFAANSLLKLYGEAVIIKALRACPTVYSLRAPMLNLALEKENKKVFIPKCVVDDIRTDFDTPLKTIRDIPFKQNKSEASKLRNL